MKAHVLNVEHKQNVVSKVIKTNNGFGDKYGV